MDTIRNPIDFIGLVLPIDNLGLYKFLEGTYLISKPADQA